jgi:hypothetical protein
VSSPTRRPTSIQYDRAHRQGSNQHAIIGSQARSQFIFAFLALLFFALLPGPARAADCGAGTLVTVVAHLDDDLLFVDPASANGSTPAGASPRCI